MSADRFSFLEFEEEGGGTGDASVRQSTGQEEVSPILRDIGAERLEDGTALAQVRIVDPRGLYSPPEDDEEGVSLSSMAAAGNGRKDGRAPTRLRVAEVFGERGHGAGQFHYPTGVAVDSQSVLFVVDADHHRLQRITPSGGVAVIGGRGSGRGQFLSPSGVAVDDEDAFYVVEQRGGRVQKFTREGVIALVFGKPGRGDGEMSGATAVAIAPGSGQIYVADTGGGRVMRFNDNGHFLGALGGNGLSAPLLGSPRALATEPGGAVYAADTTTNRVLRFDPLGRFDRQVGGPSSPVKFYSPRALALDPAGLLYVADGGAPDTLTGEMRGRVQCVSLADGKTLATIETVGRSLGSLLRPGGLTVGRPAAGSRWGDLYVADTMNHRILRFAWS